jgi:hypothetical protein
MVPRSTLQDIKDGRDRVIESRICDILCVSSGRMGNHVAGEVMRWHSKGTVMGPIASPAQQIKTMGANEGL